MLMASKDYHKDYHMPNRNGTCVPTTPAKQESFESVSVSFVEVDAKRNKLLINMWNVKNMRTMYYDGS